VLSVSKLNAWYGKSHVVRDLSIEVPDRRVVGILGRNGVGKTTTIRSIMGIVPRRQGKITLDDVELQMLSADRIARAGIAYVPQGRQLFPHLTVRENLQLAWHGDKFGDTEVRRGIAHFPPLHLLLERHAGNLSGGEQQMVAIGRALLNSPRAVLLDEPTEGLSPLFVNTVREVIATLQGSGIAVLLVEQNLHVALSVCHYIYFMEKGTIAHECPVQEARSSAVVERFLGVHIDESISRANFDT
jgi:branched-chain amino acid transport system ATP-binding protein